MAFGPGTVIGPTSITLVVGTRAKFGLDCGRIRTEETGIVVNRLLELVIPVIEL